MAYDVAGPDVSVVSHGWGPQIAVRGEFDIAVAGRVGDALAMAEATPGGVILLDLSDVTFIDSAGLQVLLEHARSSGRDGKRLRLLTSPEVDQLLDLTGTRDHVAALMDGTDDSLQSAREILRDARSAITPPDQGTSA